MPRWAKWLIVAGSYWLTLCLGGWLGVKVGRGQPKLEALGALAYSWQLASEQFDRGTDEGARAALLRHLQLIDELSRVSTLPLSSITADRIATLVRLSRLGGAEFGGQYAARARALCKDAHWIDCSDEALGTLLNGQKQKAASLREFDGGDGK
jgi:hypothetical protein